jgi:hypothetical protein
MARLVRFRWISATALVTGMLAATVGTALAAPPADQGLVPASGRLAGFTPGQLLGEEFRQVLELPTNVTPSCMFTGNKDKVLILWTAQEPAPPTVCDVKPGTPVFFYTFGVECSNVEPDPFFGATAADQRACALKYLADANVQSIQVTIDGGTPVNIANDSFLAISGQGTVNLPDPNVLGVPGNRQATFVAAAYSVGLRPLPPGTHTITVTIVGGPFPGTNRAVVNVVPGAKN